MSKLSRVIQRIFGENGTTPEFGQFGSNAASPPGTTTKDLTVIQALAEYGLGWWSATDDKAEPPRIEDRNGLDLLFSSQLVYLMQNGIPEWLDDADQRYYIDVSFVSRSGDIYKAIKGDDGANINSQKDPSSEPTWWELLPTAAQVLLNTTHRSSDGKNHSDVVLNTTHRSSDGKNHSDVVLNNTHRSSDGKNHSDVVLNNTHRSSNGSDHTYIDQDVKTTAAVEHSGGVKTDNIILKTKVIQIGDWNMDSSLTASIAHGLSNWKKVRSITAVIRNDSDDLYTTFESAIDGSSYIRISSTNIVLQRDTGGYFDSTSYNSTSYNRGWVTIIYEA